MEPVIGESAPSFTLPSSEGRQVSLSDFKGRKNVVLYFYPKDDTPGCTTEACGFRDSLPAFGNADTVVFGVSTDGGESHQSFIGKYALTYTLLTDGDGSVADSYGAWNGEKKRCRRVTAVIGKDGTLVKYYPAVKPEGHAAEVLAFLK